MIQIRRLFALILMIVCVSMVANADDDNKSYKCEGSTYSSTGRVAGNTAPTPTPYFWSDSKGNKYPIYISNSGSCYVIKTSKKTGKEYKSYLGPEISQDICKKMNREYKGKRK